MYCANARLPNSLAIALLVLQCAPTLAADSCAGQIPAALKTTLENAYPAFRIPLETDNLKEDVSFNREHGGTGCLGYASADFNGDGKSDAIIGLAARVGSGSLVIAAIESGSTWTMHELMPWKGIRSRLYVDTAPPGRYERTEVLSGPLQEGEMRSLVCSNSVAVFGATESAGVAFCFNSGKWQYVWISD